MLPFLVVVVVTSACMHTVIRREPEQIYIAIACSIRISEGLWLYIIWRLDAHKFLARSFSLMRL